MSVLAVSDLVFGDLMSELDLKPWWEKLRGYCFAASVVSTLFMIYLMLSSAAVDCIPLIAENVTAQRDLSTTQAKFINNYCTNQLPWYASYAAMMSLCSAVSIIIASSYWTLLPEVINSFRTFGQFEKIIGELDLTSDQLCTLSSEIINTNSTDECREVRKACSLLWKYESEIYVGKLYFTRNIILLIVVIMSTAVSATSLILLLADDGNFECLFDPELSLITQSNEAGHHFCSFNTTKKLQQFMLIFTLSLVAQIAFIIPGFLKLDAIKVSEVSLLTEKAKSAERYSKFMMQFFKYSRPTSCGALEQLVEHIFHDAISNLKFDLKKIMQHDFQKLRVYNNLKTAAGKEIFIAIKNTIGDDFDLCSPLHDNIVETFRYLKPKLTFAKFNEFVSYLCENRYWELLASILVMKCRDWCKERPQIQPEFKRISINLDDIGGSRAKCSFLFYVSSKKLRNMPGSRLLMEYLDPNITYIHYDDKSVRTSTIWSKTERRKNPEKEESVSRMLLAAGVLYIGKPTDEQHRTTLVFIRRVLQKKEMKESSYDRANYDLTRYSIATDLSSYKFDNWGENTKALTLFLNSKKLWEELVSLLNAFTVTEDSGAHSLLDIGCPVRDFEVTEEQVKQGLLNRPSILYFALRKADDESIFKFTAARHILNFSRGEKHMVRFNDGTCMDALTFVMQTDHEPGIKRKLAGMIKESMGQSLEFDDDGLQTSQKVWNEDDKLLQESDLSKDKETSQDSNLSQQESSNLLQDSHSTQNDDNTAPKSSNSAECIVDVNDFDEDQLLLPRVQFTPQ